MRQSMRNRRRNLEALARGKLPKGFVSQDEVLAVAQQMWEAINTPKSLKLSMLAESGQLEDVVSEVVRPSDYADYDWETAGDDYQAVAFLKKYPLEILGVNREAAALEKFWEAESQCCRTNHRFRAYHSRGAIPPRVDRVLNSARRKIDRWLGTLDTRSWALRCRFGPGADALNKGVRATAYHKLSHNSVTPEFADGARGLIAIHPVWQRVLSGGSDMSYVPGPCKPLMGSPALKLLPGNSVTFVPKNALTDRSIAIEPGLNIFAQLGLGALIRARLKKAGLDLDTQYPNQVLARQGSVDGTIATIDMSMASDTMATHVVQDLLPEGWFVALDWCRSKSGLVKNGQTETLVHYEKFSSMGNGYTFELESMIFYALALACAEATPEDLGCASDEARPNKALVRAYGDDVTVPTSCVRLLGEVLNFCGFLVNPSKSFVDGVFRESCGADFFNGVNVRPYFLKEQCDTAQSLFRLANGIRRVAYRRNLGFGCDDRLKPVWIYVVDRIPNSLRDLKIPFRATDTLWPDVESGDGGLAVNHDEAISSHWVRYNTLYQRGWLFAQLQPRPLATKLGNTEQEWHSHYLYSLYACRDGGSGEKETYDSVVSRGTSGVRLNADVSTSDWLDLGPWIGA